MDASLSTGQVTILAVIEKPNISVIVILAYALVA